MSDDTELYREFEDALIDARLENYSLALRSRLAAARAAINVLDPRYDAAVFRAPAVVHSTHVRLGVMAEYLSVFPVSSSR